MASLDLTINISLATALQDHVPQDDHVEGRDQSQQSAAVALTGEQTPKVVATVTIALAKPSAPITSSAPPTAPSSLNAMPFPTPSTPSVSNTTLTCDNSQSERGSPSAGRKARTGFYSRMVPKHERPFPVGALPSRRPKPSTRLSNSTTKSSPDKKPDWRY